MKKCVMDTVYPVGGLRWWLLLFALSLALMGYSQGFHLEGMVSRPVPVSALRMTNLVFPVPLAAGVKVSRDILVQRPKGVENVLQLKAVRRNFPGTNLSVFGKDGRVYVFDLHYTEDTAVMSFRVIPGDGAGFDTGRASVMLTGLPVDITALEASGKILAKRRGHVHALIRSGGMRLSLTGIYLRDGLMWYRLELDNQTHIAFTPAYVRVFLEDRKKVKRTASQDLDLVPVYSSGLVPVAGRSQVVVMEAFRPFTVSRGKRLVVQLADDAGGRSLVLRVKRKEVLRARE